MSLLRYCRLLGNKLRSPHSVVEQVSDDEFQLHICVTSAVRLHYHDHTSRHSQEAVLVVVNGLQWEVREAGEHMQIIESKKCQMMTVLLQGE